MQPKIKLESSPTPPVEVVIKLIKFLIRQTITPLTGPSANEAISAGKSETSILMKLGISGVLKSKNIKTAATAYKIAVTVSLRMFCLEKGLLFWGFAVLIAFSI